MAGSPSTSSAPDQRARLTPLEKDVLASLDPGEIVGSDGRWFARDGIPILIFGPSDPAVGHAVDEYVTREQLVEATRFLALLVIRWLGAPKN